MSHWDRYLRGWLFAATLAAVGGISGHAMASDPLPGDAIQLPPDINVGLFYNEFTDAGSFGAVRGHNTTKDVHISADIAVARYVRSFQAGPFIAGVQAFIPYVAFLGNQRVGVTTPFGPGRAQLSKNSGFGQPNLGAFFWPYADPSAGTYDVAGFWVAPPYSSFNKNDSLNPAENSSLFELEDGFRTTIFGTPKTVNLALEVWGEAYLFGNNTSSAAVTPSVTFNNIPGLTVPGGATPATYREEPSEEVRVFLPYTVAPAVAGVITPGFFQSFGGKQSYAIHGGPVVDSGNRTDETQLRLEGQMFISPTMQVTLAGYYDIAAHGGPLYRTLVLRLGIFF